MFVADSNQILRTNMDGTAAVSIVSEAAYKASGVAVDLNAKRLFWCDNLLDYIETVDYEGKNRFLILRGKTVYVDINTSMCNNLWLKAVKYTLLTQRWWRVQQDIELTVNPVAALSTEIVIVLEHKEPHLFISVIIPHPGQQVPSPMRLTLFENRIFWSDKTKQGILSVDKFDSSISTVYRDKSVQEPQAVKIVHALIQKPGELP